VFSGMDSRNLDDLADVVAGMGQMPRPLGQETVA
jgi:hypothetical protein